MTLMKYTNCNLVARESNNSNLSLKKRECDLSALLDFLNRKHNKTKITRILQGKRSLCEISSVEKAAGREITISAPEGTMVIDSSTAVGKWSIFSKKLEYLPIYSLLTRKEISMQQLKDKVGSLSNVDNMTEFTFMGYRVQILSKSKNDKNILSVIHLWINNECYELVVNDI